MNCLTKINKGIIKKYICTRNTTIGDNKLFNSEIIDSNIYKKIVEALPKYKEIFEPCYAATVYKYQGKTITSKYNIFDVEYMSFKEMYTALSRATKIDDIYFDYELVCDKIFDDDRNCLVEDTLLKKTKRGIIYELYTDEGMMFYVGQTIKKIEDRYKEHLEWKKGPINRCMSSDKKYKWNINILTDIYYFNENELDRLEKKYIVGYKKDGYINVNIQLQPKKVNAINNEIEMKRNELHAKAEKLLHIEELNDRYRIKYTVDGEKKAKYCRFSKKTSKAEALQKITQIRCELLKELYNIDMEELIVES